MLSMTTLRLQDYYWLDYIYFWNEETANIYIELRRKELFDIKLAEITAKHVFTN